MEKINGVLVISPFNGVFFGTFAVFILVLIIASLALRNKSVNTRKLILVTASILTFIGFFIYKYQLSIDVEYDKLRAAMDGFNWWGELPLHLCNINMILIPIAVLKDKKELMAFCFFVGPLGAFMALAMPGAEFRDFSLLLPRMMGYYGTHFMIVILGLAIVTFGLYKPNFKDFPRIIVTIFIISVVIFAINMAMRLTGLYPKANYFYSVETEGNFVLEIIHRFLPYPFLYELPCILILVVYMSVVTLGFTIGRKLRKPKEDPPLE